MSKWTHINGSIRFEGFDKTKVPNKKDLGQICNAKDKDDSHWETSIIPCGSEGSIKYKITKIDDVNNMIAIIINFYGDLRDYQDYDEILTYFNKIVKGRVVISGLIEVDMYPKDVLILRYDERTNTFVTINTINSSV